ncbi:MULTISPECIES: beta-ketoacyl-ACP synthase III [Curtobacterium]|jgi:3-oxoacyl-[acyl-carrier-protein] synthase-3|uniref:beta-ketoacyl-ACP synthase III n=1 Tax=Curtobacterium TaxID=2034 RepID=UPI000A01EB70|nr:MULTISPECIES: beta-ketoacyl-ACP synthase III [Curtobacterium]UXN20939.1 ketoacyl-ACP synthase III [Curtobacterium flaccumfaciens pv. flaccumfaciens]WIE58257.1 beta-ketoacyl-ACP synthase III [Curtobacterium sp. MCLR17_031]
MTALDEIVVDATPERDPHATTTRTVLQGLGGALPRRVVTNDDLAATLDTTDEWIRSRTGIGARHQVDPGTSTSDLAVAAGRRALENAGVDSVDMVIVATSTPDHRCPATAPDVAARLGLGTVPAFDLAAVCSGFVYGLAQADALIRSGAARRVLLIGADTFTTLVDPGDRANAVIFGDGAGAVVLGAGQASDAGALGSVTLGSDGTGLDLIRVEAGGSRQPVVDRGDPTAWFAMQGRAVFAAAVTAMADSCRSVLDAAGWAVDDVDHLVAHQANRRILTMVAASIGVAADRAVLHLDRVGNTSAASIPLALAAHATEMRTGARVLLTAFGGGATWGAGTLTWPTLTAPVIDLV